MKKRYVFLLLAVCAALLLFPASADELKLPSELKEIGEEAFMGDQGLDTVILPEQLSTIGARAFAGSSLKEIVLPDALTSIADDAFSGCVNLTVRASEGSYAYCWAVQNGYIQVEPAAPEDFKYSLNQTEKTATITKYIGNGGYVVIPEKIENCDVVSIWRQAFTDTAVTGVEIPETVKRIDYMAFSGCKSLVSVILPSAIDSLGEGVFSNCDKLLSIRIPDGIQEISYGLFYKCASLTTVQMPDSVISIGSHAFESCESLSSISLPESLTSIGVDAFDSCKSLSNISLPNSVTSIGSGAFGWCTNLEEINVPTGLTAIPDSFVYNCSKLKQLVIPEGITSIGKWAFGWCSNLEEINVPTRLTAIPDYFVYHCSMLKQLVIPESVTSIGEHAFDWCSNLEEINVPTGLTAIPDYFMYHCSKLKQLVIPEGITSIGEHAFDSCESLSNLSLPASILSIQSSAFAGFSGILLFSGNAPSIADDAFGSNSRIIIIYPHDKTGWSDMIGKSYGAKWLYWQADNAQSETPETEKDASETLQGTVTNNEGKNEYATVWECGVSSSYLTRESDGTYTRVEYANNTVYIEQYNSSLQLTWKKSLSPELPVWGGYFAGTDSNFLFFGQNNDEMDDAKEVIRVVRYTKNWNRVDMLCIRAADTETTNLGGSNTKNPFAFGTMNCTQSDDILYLHTSRVMYNGHQSNLNFKIFIPTMERLEQSSVYVSHSFNQYVIEDEDNIIWLNHGDAYPRALLLTVENNSAGVPKEGNKTSVTLMEFGGSLESELYQNTYATVGGLECSGTHYLAVGKSIDQSQYGTAKRQNIYVISLDKHNLTSDGVTMRWLTSYPESDTRYVSNPQFVKISSTKFLILWTEAETSYSGDKEVHYVFLNGQGMPVSQEYTAKGKLSDCQPIVSGNKVMWYVTNNSASVFYSIDLDNPGTLTIQ